MRLLAPTDGAGTLLQQGLISLKQGQLEQARASLEQASTLEPQNPFVWASLAETYLRLQEPGKASAAAATAEKEGVSTPAVAHALALYYAKIGDRVHAVKLERSYRAAAWEKAKTDPKIAFEYVQMLLEDEEFARAAEVTSSALAAHPDDPQLLLALGVARYGERRFEDAIELFLKVIRIDPAIEQPYVFLGKMLDQAGDRLGEITKAYESWSAAQPQNALAPMLWAKALLVADPHSAQAEQLLKHSIALDSNDWQAHYQLGLLLEDRHDYTAAATELLRAIELDPKQPLPHYHLARVYDRLGQPDRAQAERELHEKLAGTKAH